MIKDRLKDSEWRERERERERYALLSKLGKSWSKSRSSESH